MNLPQNYKEQNHYFSTISFFQIRRCDNRDCCGPPRGNLHNALRSKFLPAPFPFRQDPFGIPKPHEVTSEKFPSLCFRQSLALRPQCGQTKELPYDFYCPSQRDAVASRTCPECGLYFTSLAGMRSHRYDCHAWFFFDSLK